MKKKIVILGSTGSIGVNTLKVIENNKRDFEIVLLSRLLSSYFSILPENSGVIIFFTINLLK